MNESLLVGGIVCIVASIVGGGIKLLGAEVPILNSFARQALLFAVGLAFLAGSYLTSLPKTSTPAPVATETSAAPSTARSPHSASTPPVTASDRQDATSPAAPAAPASGCAPATGLSCLPASSHPVTFANETAANAEAWRDYRKGLSTTAGETAATNGGATGKAARLCGIVASNDSSALGKHLAAVALTGRTAEGLATPFCLSVAGAYL